MLPGLKAHFLRLTHLNGWLVWLCTEAEQRIKSEKMKTGSMGWSVCGQEWDCFRVYRGVEGGDRMMENCVFAPPPFSFLGRNPQMREEENLNGRRHDCDFVNISAGFGSQTVPTVSRTRCADVRQRGRYVTLVTSGWWTYQQVATFTATKWTNSTRDGTISFITQVFIGSHLWCCWSQI